MENVKYFHISVIRNKTQLNIIKLLEENYASKLL